MIFTVDSGSNRISAMLMHDDRMVTYDCSIYGCKNPVCMCETVSLDLIPARGSDENNHPLPARTLEINIDKKSLGGKNKKKAPKEDLKFAKLFLSKMDENDFQLLYRKYFEFKNKITEESCPDSIDGYFEYDKIEHEGLMYAYNDVLPYGDQLIVDLNGMKCMILDQYCLLPHCSCTETMLNVFSMDKNARSRNELCAVLLKYKEKKWEMEEKRLASLNIGKVRSVIEAQYPKFYQLLKKRHVRLKTIYSHCKKRNYTSAQEIRNPKVGRNDPCPCGSGKKYKKCCLMKNSI